MDWKLSFTPNDLSDVTLREQAFQTNPKIVLEIKVGKGYVLSLAPNQYVLLIVFLNRFLSAPFPVLLEDMSFVGNMRIRLKLMNNFPHVQLVEMSFLEKPIFGTYCMILILCAYLRELSVFFFGNLRLRFEANRRGDLGLRHC